MSDFVLQGFESFEIKPVRKKKHISSSRLNAVKIFAAILDEVTIPKYFFSFNSYIPIIESAWYVLIISLFPFSLSLSSLYILIDLLFLLFHAINIFLYYSN